MLSPKDYAGVLSIYCTSSYLTQKRMNIKLAWPAGIVAAHRITWKRNLLQSRQSALFGMDNGYSVLLLLLNCDFFFVKSRHCLVPCHLVLVVPPQDILLDCRFIFANPVEAGRDYNFLSSASNN